MIVRDSQLSGLGGAWEDWCDQKYADGQPNGSKAMRDRCRAWSPCGPPWTDVGAGCRGLPKDSLITTIVGTVRLPEPAEYDPENLITLWFRDPARFAVLGTYVNIVLPLVGAGYMAQFVPPQMIALGLPAAIGVCLARGGWDRVWHSIFEPALQEGGLMAETLLAYALQGNSALAAYAIKKIGLKLPPGPQRAIILAIADAGGTVIDAIRHPQDFKRAFVYQKIGTTILQIADATEPGKRTPAVVIGEALNTFAQPIEDLLQGRGFGVALNSLSSRVFGIDFIGLQKSFGEERKRHLAMMSQNLSGLDTINAFGSAIDSLNKALGQIKFGDIGAKIGAVFNDAMSVVSSILGELNKPAPVPTSTAVVQVPRTAAASLKIPTFVAPAAPATTKPAPLVVKPAAPPPLPAAPAKSNLPAVAAAGGAGFLVGGPAGAAVGAGLALLLSLKR